MNFEVSKEIDFSMFKVDMPIDIEITKTKDNKYIRILDCKKMWGLGVPNDLKRFITHYLKEYIVL